LVLYCQQFNDDCPSADFSIALAPLYLIYCLPEEALSGALSFGETQYILCEYNVPTLEIV
jgi:hypothetical protein